MVENQTVFEGVISFMRDLGFFKVIIPFLVSFTLVYAIFDKTAVLGLEKNGEPKRSLNAMIAFSVALFVVGTEIVVGIINEALANIVVVLLLVTFFLLTISVFMTEGGTYDLTQHKGLFFTFVTFILIAFIAIFLAAMGWLNPMLTWIQTNWRQDWVATLIFLIGIAGFIWFIGSDSKVESGGS
jgi:hypothetical protein